MVKFHFGLGNDDKATDPAQTGDNKTSTDDTVVKQDDSNTPVQNEASTSVVEETPLPNTEEIKSEDTPTEHVADLEPVEQVKGVVELTEAPATEDINPSPAEPIAIEPTPDSNLNPFANSSFSGDQPTEPTTEVIAKEATPVIPEPFVTESPVVASEPVEQVKPVIELSPAEPTPETAIEETTPEEISPAPITFGGSNKNDTATTSSGDPLVTLKQVKGEIEGYVKTHKDNIKNLQDQIRDLEQKIQDEKKELRNKQTEFSSMIKDMENLTKDFNGNGNENHRPNRQDDSKNKKNH